MFLLDAFTPFGESEIVYIVVGADSVVVGSDDVIL